MRVLKVIHGYPMRYNAGSEVYSQALCHALAQRHHVHVFTREEDPHSPDYAYRKETDPIQPAVRLHLVNMPRARDGYRHAGVDSRFAEVLGQVRPDVVHIGHLNHLSTSLVQEAARREIPVVYTLHDYWLACPRGQFIQTRAEDPLAVWPLCDGQDDRKCAESCYARYFSGAPDERGDDVTYWTGWVSRRMRHVRQVVESIDAFVAPSAYLMQRVGTALAIPQQKLVHLDYGFDLQRLSGRQRTPGTPFTFGYIGTHIPAKGVHLLLDAFCGLGGKANLIIWGRASGQETEALKRRASAVQASGGRIEWRGEYENHHIVRDVFNHVDAIVVPSIWPENAPLVIHEAQQARVPVITADLGGMAEFVRHEVNGLLFQPRDAVSLQAQMQRMLTDQPWAARLGARGYLHSGTGDVPDINAHAAALEQLYAQLLSRRDQARVIRARAPWRITFDTNPDTCNMHCIMCEEHSPHSNAQRARRDAGSPRRVMPFEYIAQTVAEMAPRGLREIIPSTMGEPLLYEQFEDIIALCEKHGVKLNLTTNGTFPRLGAKAWAERIVPVTSDVKISWNAAQEKTHNLVMLGSAWAAVLENARTFIAVRDAHAAAGGNRCRVTFQLTFMEVNVGELVGIVKLAASLGVDRVKGHHLWAHFDEIQIQSLRRSTDAIRRWNDAVRAAHAAAAANRLPNGRAVLLENFFPLDEAAPGDVAPGGACPFLGQEAWLNTSGRFDPCCAPDAQRRALGSFGHLGGGGFLPLWEGQAYGELLATYRTRSLCLGCNMRRPREGA